MFYTKQRRRPDERCEKGKVWAIATGPGSSDLITVRAARQLGELDVLYAPRAQGRR